MSILLKSLQELVLVFLYANIVECIQNKGFVIKDVGLEFACIDLCGKGLSAIYQRPLLEVRLSSDLLG